MHKIAAIKQANHGAGILCPKYLIACQGGRFYLCHWVGRKCVGVTIFSVLSKNLLYSTKLLGLICTVIKKRYCGILFNTTRFMMLTV